MKRTAIDLFSGCGGMTVGLHQAGFSVIGAIELDELAVRTYRKNHPNIPLWHSDIRKVSSRTIKTSLGLKKGELDLLAGCPPCQGFSRLRTLNGMREVHDPRNDLILEFSRLVDELRPRAVMMENVPGLARDRRLKQFLQQLRRLGYHCKHDIVDVAKFGVPQRRARLIVLCGRAAEIPFCAPASRRRTVRDAFDGLLPSGSSGDPAHDVTDQRSARILEMIKHIPADGGSRSDLPPAYQLECHKRCDGFHDVYGRMKWNDVAPTITSGFVNPSKGRFLHPQAHRTITVREASLLQTFPAAYWFPMEAGKYPVAEMIGNAIPPEYIRRQARRIASHLNFYWK